MKGLHSLMQGYNLGGAVDGQGMPKQPEQPQQAPPVSNDPRMDAAMGVVDGSVEKFNLDPQTEALMLKNQALQLLQAADNVGKMGAPQQNANIQEQTNQGIDGLLQNLAPGMQQRGQQMQQAQARQMVGGPPPAGGMPTMGAPNMARMAYGGIVGYGAGGDVNTNNPPVPTMGSVPTKAADSEDIKRLAALYSQATASLAAAKDPRDKAAVKARIDDLKNQMGTQLPYVMQYLDSTNGMVEPRTGGMARGGIIGYAPGGDVDGNQGGQAGLQQGRLKPPSAEDEAIKARTRELMGKGLDPFIARQQASAEVLSQDVSASARTPVSQAQAIAAMSPTVSEVETLISGADYDAFTSGPERATFTEYQPELDGPLPVGGTGAGNTGGFNLTANDLAAEENLSALLAGDPEQAATDRGAEFKALTTFGGLEAKRTAAEKAVRDQKESRLSPEQARKRRMRAGLAGFAERGFGGFNAGLTTEMDKIAGERLGIEETSLAQLNSLIAEKRAMGLSQFEAENEARAEMQGQVNSATAVASASTDIRRAAQVTAQEKQRDRENRLKAAEMQVAGGNETDLVRSLEIRKNEIRDANPELSETEIASRAMNMLDRQETSAALARVGIQASQQNFARYEGAANLVIKRITNDFNWSTLSAVEKQSVYETAIDDEMANIARVLGDTPSARNPNTPPLTSFDGS